MNLKTANITRVPSSGEVSETTYVLVAGSTLPNHGQFASLTTLLALDTGLAQYNMGAVGGAGGGWRHRGARISFGGTGADNSTYSVKIYASMAAESGQRTLRLLGTVAVTLSATVGASGLLLDSTSHRIADTITWTESAFYTAERAAYGIAAASAFSPGSDLEAVLDIVDCLGASELIFDFDMTGATGGVLFVEGWT